jgi:selenocysteine-specific translation elongation factor
MGSSVTVAVVGAGGIAPELGKKGTASDVALYNAVHDEHAATLVEPVQFPEKFPPLLVALGMADQCLLAVTELTRAVAETIAVVELTEVPVTVITGPAVGEAELARALRGSRLESAPRVGLDLPHLRSLIEGWSAPDRAGPVEVPVDHAFPVQGVGTVALGVVRRGLLRAHDRLRLWPTAKEIDVRSIQVHDVDRREAACGERVGVALKGVDADEISRGHVLAPAGSLSEGTALPGTGWTRCRYYRGDAGPGARLNAVVGLQVVPVAVDALSESGVRLTADRPVVWEPGGSGFLLDLSVPAGPRIVGRWSFPGS